MIRLTVQPSVSLLISQYKFFQKSSRKLLTHTKYFQRCQVIKKNNRTALMFVRAPKHFKTGKQRVVFFSSLYRQQIFLKTSSTFFNQAHSHTLFLLGQQQSRYINRPDILLSRITLKTEIFFKIVI